MRIVAIDPGNDVTGVALYVDGVLDWSATFCPWNRAAALGADVLWQRADRCYVERPAHGTHETREGIMFSAGMTVAQLNVARRDVVRVTPGKWRSGLGLLTKGAGKPYYVLEARKIPGAEGVEDHNEAEAILIGKYACLMEGDG